ncbi:MAG: EAL domain-containing protein [Campylobacterota bacterium]|nr:EAL domain-containing protein [Campylobacterota bacterium]
MKELFSFLTFSTSRLNIETEKELLGILYANLSKSVFANIVNATLFLFVLWSAANHALLLWWFAGLTLVSFLRHLDGHYFSKHFALLPNKIWYWRMALGVGLSGLFWGSTLLLFFPGSQVEYQMFIIIVILGMSAGSVTTLSADLRISLGYLIILLLPLAFELFQQEGDIYLVLFVMTLMFIAIVSGASRQFYAALVKTYDTLALYQLSQAKLKESEKSLRMIFEQTPAGIFYYDHDLKIIDCNSAFCHLLSADKEQLIGLDMRQLPDQSILPTIRDALTSGVQVREGLYHTKISKLTLWAKIQCAPIIDADNNIIGGVGIVEDKTKEHAAMQEAEFLSLHDPLTQLPNRKLLKERIKQAMKEDKRKQHYSAMLFLDLDRFKQVNDSFGHVIGDKLLVETARRLEMLLRQSDTLSRLGGDEFVVLLPLLSEEQDTAMHYAHQVAEKIHDTLSKPFTIDEHALFTACSIGIVLLNTKVYDTDELLRRADTAMYQAKDEGRNRTRFYDPTMDAKAKAYIRIQHNLRHAIKHNELALNFQPVVQIGTNTITAAEVLLRWHPQEGAISPADFIPVAEESGLIKEIGKWVIEQTCMQINQWVERALFTLDYVTINVSSKQLHDPDLSAFILDTLQHYRINPAWIRLEITETALIENFDRTKEIIEQLNAEGIEFIIDDFGTGYSSLSYLKNLPFSMLKIDRTFIRDILTDEGDAALIRAIIDISNQFDYRVVAEGVEHEAQRIKLFEIDKNIYYQGFLYSRPVDVKKFEDIMKTKIV